MALSPVLQFSDRVFCLPIIHGSGDFAIEVRRVMLSQRFDCLAVPLPPSFQHDVEQAITRAHGKILEEPRVVGTVVSRVRGVELAIPTGQPGVCRPCLFRLII